MKKLLGLWDLHAVRLDTSVICYVASMEVRDDVMVSIYLTRKQGDVGSSPAQSIVPIFSDEFV